VVFLRKSPGGCRGVRSCVRPRPSSLRLPPISTLMMTRQMWLVVPVLVVCVCSPRFATPAQSQEITFRDIPWGISASEIAPLMRSLGFDEDSRSEDKVIHSNRAGQRAVFNMGDAGFEQLTFMTRIGSRTEAEAIESRLVARHGRPADVSFEDSVLTMLWTADNSRLVAAIEVDEAGLPVVLIKIYIGPAAVAAVLGPQPGRLN
jgi:hypothetical protein